MTYEKYASGTIKLKNTVGELIPFYPVTKESCITDVNTGDNISDAVYSIQNTVERLSNSGGIKVLYEDDDSAIETFINNQSNESMVVALEPDYWSYTVDTRLYDNTETNAKTSIPFDLYNVNDASIKVDWGDNTTSTFTSSDYSSNTTLNSSSSTSFIHTYENPGIYTVKISSSNFYKVKIYNNSNTTYGGSPLSYYRGTLIEINNPLPELNITDFQYFLSYCRKLTTLTEDLFKNNTQITSFENCFKYCSSLITIPENLFRYNINVTQFGNCFSYCSSLTSIPENLFKYNIAVTDFGACFKNCTSLTSIPENLFRYNTAVTTFTYCFESCTTLTSIPENLFRYNINVTQFGNCFWKCSALTSIPENLFKYNINAVYFGYCFNSCSSLGNFAIHIGSSLVTASHSFVTKKTGTTRTVYVPNNSTTKTTFNGVASSLGLTVIGE